MIRWLTIEPERRKDGEVALLVKSEKTLGKESTGDWASRSGKTAFASRRRRPVGQLADRDD